MVATQPAAVAPPLQTTFRVLVIYKDKHLVRISRVPCVTVKGSHHAVFLEGIELDRMGMSAFLRFPAFSTHQELSGGCTVV